MPNAVVVDGLFSPQRTKLGFDSRESTPGVKRQVVLLNAETRSLKKASKTREQLTGLNVSTNTIERICLDLGEDLEWIAQDDWKTVLTGENVVPNLAIVSCDGGTIQTRQPDCGPETDPEPQPPECFVTPNHVAKLTEQAKTKEETGDKGIQSEKNRSSKRNSKKPKKVRPKHKPKRILRTVLSSIKNSSAFGSQMAKEANRRRFAEASRKAFVADGQSYNWSIHEAHFRDYTPILDSFMQ